MNKIAKNILEYLGIHEEDSLMHHGVGHLNGGHSGRYPWGSGEDAFQRGSDFLARIDKLKQNRLERNRFKHF